LTKHDELMISLALKHIQIYSSTINVVCASSTHCLLLQMPPADIAVPIHVLIR